MTTDVPFAEIVEEGTATLSPDSVTFEVGADGTIQRAVQIGYNKIFPRVGINRDGAGPLNLPGDPKFGVNLPEASVWFTPTIEFAVETKWFSVQRAAIQVRGEVEAALVPELTYRPVGTDGENEKEWPMHTPIKTLTLVGTIGYLPVWMEITYSTKLKIIAEANAAITLKAGWRRGFSISAQATYTKDASPAVAWARSATLSPLEEVPITLSGGGTVQGKVSMVPQLDVRLESLLGFHVNADPRYKLEATASGGFTFSAPDGKLQIAPTGSLTPIGGIFADPQCGVEHHRGEPGVFADDGPIPLNHPWLGKILARARHLGLHLARWAAVGERAAGWHS